MYQYTNRLEIGLVCCGKLSRLVSPLGYGGFGLSVVNGSNIWTICRAQYRMKKKCIESVPAKLFYLYRISTLTWTVVKSKLLKFIRKAITYELKTSKRTTKSIRRKRNYQVTRWTVKLTLNNWNGLTWPYVPFCESCFHLIKFSLRDIWILEDLKGYWLDGLPMVSSEDKALLMEYWLVNPNETWYSLPWNNCQLLLRFQNSFHTYIWDIRWENNSPLIFTFWNGSK